MKRTDMLFSVIIPLYNKAGQIGRALQSVAAQTFRDFELIVVDDGSTDNSLDVVARFRDSDAWKNCGVEMRIVRQANCGASSARNRGVNEAKGEFVTMLDGDDEWLPNHLADLKAVYDAYPEAKVMTTNTVSVHNGIVERSKHKMVGVGLINIFDFPEGGYPISSDTITIDRDLFLSLGGYDTHYSYFEDREFYYRLGEAVGDFYVNWAVSAYYHHDAGLSAHTGRRRGYGEYGYLCLAEKRAQVEKIMPRMKRCAVLSVNNLIRGNVVRFRFEALREIMQAFPCLVNEIFTVRHFAPHGLLPIVWCVYFVEWLFARGFLRLRGLCHA